MRLFIAMLDRADELTGGWLYMLASSELVLLVAAVVTAVAAACSMNWDK